MWITRVAAVLLALAVVSPLRASVVINEIFYHAPDDLDNLQFVELHNTGDQAIDLSGWKLTKAVKFTFPAKTSIERGDRSSAQLSVMTHARRISIHLTSRVSWR